MNANRRTVLKGLGAGTATLVGGVGAAAAKPPSEGETIVDVAVAADGFDVFVAAVQEAGLVDTLSGNRQLTAFAPTDEAFNAAGITVDNVGDVDGLGDVLTYHVVPGRRKANSIVNASQVPTLNGAKVDVDGTDLNGDQADIVDTDIEASNGIIHVIDGVLQP
ncbi:MULTISPECIES: fasciclin domain-containing protein [unclassified Halorubrum]|uniref:fasciclin domain-containing protein n=1 Tax=unclassified Halorubrum TaxID=2642239 RepID=UPI0010F439DF|nr:MULTISPECIES: fasciclin domain-containing protein [unclassified Halorubrum]TKX41052.1 fasciclin domain-containing protein [Halorubrum sp. ARQ200]TKX48675.1 fasciclin domain-containing protein [Halorubrum sp. ASP121]